MMERVCARAAHLCVCVRACLGGGGGVDGWFLRVYVLVRGGGGGSPLGVGDEGGGFKNCQRWGASPTGIMTLGAGAWYLASPRTHSACVQGGGGLKVNAVRAFAVCDLPEQKR